MADHMAGGKGARKGHRTRRKKRSVLSAVLTVLLVLLLLAAGGVGFLALRSLNRIEKVDKEKEVWITPEFENFETDEPELPGLSPARSRERRPPRSPERGRLPPSPMRSCGRHRRRSPGRTMSTISCSSARTAVPAREERAPTA